MICFESVASREICIGDSKLFVSLLIVAFVAGLIGYWLGDKVGKSGVGFGLGFLLGPIGWILVLLLPRDERPPVKGQDDRVDDPPKEPSKDSSMSEIKIWVVGLLIFGGVLGSQLFFKEIKEGNLVQKRECIDGVVPVLTETLTLSREEAEKIATSGCSDYKARKEMMKLIDESKSS